MCNKYTFCFIWSNCFYSECLVYHENLLFFTKLSILFLIAQFACANIAAKDSSVNLLNSGVEIYLPLSGISFTAAVKSIVVAKLVILGILF